MKNLKLKLGMATLILTASTHIFAVALTDDLTKDQFCSAHCYTEARTRSKLVYHKTIDFIAPTANAAFRQLIDQCQDGVLVQRKIIRIDYYRSPEPRFQLIEADALNSCRDATEVDRKRLPRDSEGNIIL